MPLSLQLPDLATAQVGLCYSQLAEAFFGSDGFTADRICLKEPVRRFIDSLMVAYWANIRSRVDRERKRLVTLQENVNNAWNST